MNRYRFDLILINSELIFHIFKTSSNSNTNEKSNSSSSAVENTNSNTITNSNANENTISNTSTIDMSQQNSLTRERTFRVSKMISVPPFSGVKISSYVNWIHSLKIPFRLNVKLSIKTSRRRMDGKGTNEIRNADYVVTENYLKQLDFPGIIAERSYDFVIAQIPGTLTASLGLDSVFKAIKINMNEN